MTCHTCGRQIQNETANFCEYCGASFREHAQTASNPGVEQPFYSRPFTAGPTPDRMAGPQQGEAGERPTSILGWLGMYAVLLVPFANIIVLLIWAFSDAIPANRKNWARATLIFLGVIFILGFILIVGYMNWVMSTPIYQQMMQEYGAYYK